MKGPLTSLAVRLRTLGERDPQSTLVAGCLRELTALEELLTSFLELEAARLSPEFSSPGAVTDVGAVLGELDARHRPAADARHVGLDIEGAGDAGVLALGEPRATTRIVSNLLDNAIKFSREAGRVHLRLRKRNGEVRIEVANEGIGIPPDAKERIFEAFYRADREKPGAGLGLAIARRLAEAIDASLEAESEPGRGATFTLTLKTPQ